ncbi:PREDICTED: uncharacterized protein LOC104763037 [Camelina sativa]|uniref:Uncharacterized protein LOC104763037 n=1 Tax=Camelina sativa TaxID=90675 RepID=A0ABM0XEJ9_CAMSA|nr:PREDICTED: uncharacterized protein LOC104763037 [Camelina sativa]
MRTSGDVYGADAVSTRQDEKILFKDDEEKLHDSTSSPMRNRQDDSNTRPGGSQRLVKEETDSDSSLKNTTTTTTPINKPIHYTDQQQAELLRKLDSIKVELLNKPNQIVVLLIGPPGSGKSTFCDTVMRSFLRPWSCFCQDIINNGKAGTKAQCLKIAISSLKEGKSVFIDRCNLDREQRSEFVKLGGPSIEVHAVVLEIPAQSCSCW